MDNNMEKKEPVRYVSIGMWPEDYRFKLDVIVSHRTRMAMARQNRGVILGELIEKEYENTIKNIEQHK